ncbi:MULTISPECIES: bifunctional cobalt-precorrin-7 (C(5))-methyltransferase/cobalt-precorrin-6B (C(15))-methyltransferase [unclassified Prochlorococcus]|uniref:bifunctional cobalt-precorrin-7 (C(5))-methyltransferase/cobalt-precorrin-6B (C(15))-methyltransferase n=1 Tax=unclassified Prochlorococcus TaxID=2627481 RepID=UPI000690A7EC|nr:MULTISPECIES: bifunctional cobalt-precorrin-7 (C(5))-methyltransferase/cobalt-precorrin-6B (C(15))-methyltransferase [unclassified Prochlorococcus]
MVRNNKNKAKEGISIDIIGVSASGVADLSSRLQGIVLSARNISAPRRLLISLKDWWNKQNSSNPFPIFFATDNPGEFINWLNEQDQKTVVLASGDPLWFGIGRILLKNFPSEKLVFHPSPTSLQLAFSRLAIPWQDAHWISLHGRETTPLTKLLQKRPNTIGILTDPNRGGAQEVRAILAACELENIYSFWIFENLGHKQERTYRISPKEELPLLDPLHLVVLIKDKEPFISKKDIPLFGIEDGFYLSYQDRPGLMTKREIRIQLLADLELPETGVIWDIGAGVGTIGLEALRLRPKLELLSIEKRLGGEELIKLNARRLAVFPRKIIEADALSILEKEAIPSQLAQPNRVILGGGGSEKINLLNEIIARIKPTGIIVIPLATIENLEKIANLLKKKGFQLKISQHQNLRGVSLKEGTRLNPMNPVFIIKGKFQ